MACQDTWLESERAADERQRRRKERVRNLAIYVNGCIPHKGKIGYDHQENTRFLCSTLKKMSKDQLDTIVYDGRIKEARDLADWWEEHQEMDRQREKEEGEKARLRKVKKDALAKLTLEERTVLGI